MRSNALDEVIGFPQQCIMNACGASGASMPPKKLGIFFLKRKKTSKELRNLVVLLFSCMSKPDAGRRKGSEERAPIFMLKKKRAPILSHDETNRAS